MKAEGNRFNCMIRKNKNGKTQIIWINRNVSSCMQPAVKLIKCSKEQFFVLIYFFPAKVTLLI